MRREKGIVLEDAIGRAKPFGGEALAKLFSLLAGQVECLLLNACHSQKQAEAIAEETNIVHVDPELHPLLPDSEAVNCALREYIAHKQIQQDL